MGGYQRSDYGVELDHVEVRGMYWSGVQENVLTAPQRVTLGHLFGDLSTSRAVMDDGQPMSGRRVGKLFIEFRQASYLSCIDPDRPSFGDRSSA